MRVTDKMMQGQALKSIQKNRSELAQLQNQAATGKKLTTPSDDPVGATKVLTNRTELKNQEQFEKNIFQAKNFLDVTESTLAQLGEAIVRTKELALQAASDTIGESQRTMIGSEVEQIYNSILEMSNRRVGERYLFGGYRTQETPFDRQGDYRGDDGEMRVQTQKGIFVAMNMTGDRVFAGKGIGRSEYQRQPEEVPQNTQELQQFKLSEIDREYHNQLKPEDAAALRSPASVGRVQGAGVESEDASAQSATQTEEGVNVFRLIKGLDVALKTNDKYAIQDALEPLDQALNQINLIRAEIGGRINQLEATADIIHKSNVDNKTLTSQVEDADLFQTMSELSRADTTLKSTLEVAGRLESKSLLDFLR